MTCSMEFRIPSEGSPPWMFSRATMSTPLFMAWLLCPVATMRFTPVRTPFSSTW